MSQGLKAGSYYDVGVPASYYGYPVTATTLFHNASYESAVPVALQLLDAAYLKVAAPSCWVSRRRIAEVESRGPVWR